MITPNFGLFINVLYLRTKTEILTNMTFEQEGKGKIKRSGKGLVVSHLIVINHNSLHTNFSNNFIGLVFMKLKTLLIDPTKNRKQRPLGNRIWEYICSLVIVFQEKKVLFPGEHGIHTSSPLS